MRLIITGPPGSGKGTQAQLLSQRLGLHHVSTGDILRVAVARDTPEGQKAKAYMAGGQLVPDALVNDIVNARFRATTPPKFIMDGYPRTLAQAESFDAMLKDLGLGLDAVISLKVDDDEIVTRNSARWTCINPECKATYNTLTKPPRVAGRCDLCQHLLHQREDDNPDTIRRRLKVFHEQAAGILDHYARLGRLIDVHGRGDIEAIYASILKALGK